LNYIDVYFRTACIRCRAGGLGMEAAGEVTALGSGVSGVKWATASRMSRVRGAYAQERVLPAAQVVKCRMAERRAGRLSDAASLTANTVAPHVSGQSRDTS